MGLRVIGAGLRSIRYLTHSSNFNSATITVPASVKAGDMLVFADITSNGSGGSLPGNVVPSGFTQIVTSGVGSVRATMSRKLAVDADASAVLTGMNGVSDHKLLAVFRPSIRATAAVVSDPDIENAAGNPDAQTIASGAGTPPLVAVGVYWASAENPLGRSMSPAQDGEIAITPLGGLSLLYMRFKYYDAGQTPSNVVVDMADSDFSSVLSSFYFTMSR